jgi:hypothetical protein
MYFRVMNLTYCSTGSTNISQSFRRFGLSAESDRVVVVMFHATEEKWKRVIDLVEGKLIPTDGDSDLVELSTHFDFKTAIKYYGITHKGLGNDDSAYLRPIVTTIACHHL